MASLSAYYPLPVVAGTTAGTYAEGDRVAQLGAGSTVRVSPSNASTVERSLRDRFGEVFHVDDYGAVGDWNGSTGTDDTAAIQAAINAAVAAGGGVVRFGAGKKYRLNTRNTKINDTIGRNDSDAIRHFLRIGSGNLTSNFGSTEMMLYFDGQGATLHATAFSTGGNDIIYTCCQFHTLVFSDLKFTRSTYETSALGNQANALVFYAADYNTHQQVLIQNCYFKNHLASIDFSGGWNLNQKQLYGKLKCVDVVNCIFEHDNGSNRVPPYPLFLGHGALVVYMNTWIEVANFDRCHANGLTTGQTSATYMEPMHGFLFPMPIQANFSNCFFTHFCIEVIKASDQETAQTGISLNGGFTQVANGANLSVTLAINRFNLQNLEVGKIYCFFDPTVFDDKRGGFYKLEAKTGGGNYTFAVGGPTPETLNFTRIDGSLYNFPSAKEWQAGQTFGSDPIQVLDLELLERCGLNVSNCTFYNRPIKNSSGNDINADGETWDAPSILVNYSAVICGNRFYGGASNFYSSVTCCDFLPTVISANIFYKYTDRVTQPTSGGYAAIYSRKGNVIISENSFIAREARAFQYMMFIGNNNITIKNNTCIVNQPASSGNDGVSQNCYFINYDGGGPWNVISEDNYLKDLEHYGNSGDAGHIAHYIGSIRGTFVRSGSQPIRLAKQSKSPDGSTWTIGVTNDGELEVIK
jgi:hypothetical protein